MRDNEFYLALDLLPLYIEGKVCPESEQLVRKALEENEELREIYDTMCQEIQLPASRRKGRFFIHKSKEMILVVVLGYAGLLAGIVAALYHMLTWALY